MSELTAQLGPAERARTAGVAQQNARLVEVHSEGVYRRMVFEVNEIAELARPGQFVALTVGGDLSAALLRRSFSIYRALPPIGPGPGRIELIVAAYGKGTRWLTSRGPGEVLDMVGPLGRPFPLPTQPVGCVLVGGGYGSVPLFWLTAALRERGCAVSLVLGAGSRDRLFGVLEAQRLVDQVSVTTDDGSLGMTGLVSDALPGAIQQIEAGVVYACGPMPMLRAVQEVAQAQGVVSQLAVEESMACGIGVCMTCVVPVVGRDGVTRMVRSCVEGPVFRGDRIRWDAIEDGRCSVPPDALGALVSEEQP